MAGSAFYRARGYYDVTEYGAKGTGLVDDTAAIQAAITACAATGGVVWVPPGIYNVGATLTCVSSNVQVRGAGWSSHFVVNFASGNLFDFEPATPPAPTYSSSQGLSGLVFRDFSVSHSATHTSGAVIRAAYTTGTIVDNIKIGEFDDSSYNALHGVQLDFAGNPQVTNFRCFMSGVGVRVTGTNSAYAGYWDLDGAIGGNSMIYGRKTAGSRGIYYGGGHGGLYIGAIDVGQCEYGLLVDSAVTGNGNRELFLGPGAFFDDCSSHCAYINNIVQVQIASGWGSGSDGGHGLYVVSASFVSISGGTYYANLGDGIRVDSASLIVNGVTARSNGGYGINITGTGVNNYTITGNTTLTNTGGTIHDLGGSTKTVANNTLA